MPLPGGRNRVGDYFIECHLGTGGMGDVYLAKQISMKREVALKILRSDLASDSKYLERFFREVRLLAQIEHSNVVRAIEAGKEDDVCYFSMEYVHGKDLKRQIDLGRDFGEQETLRIAAEIVSALRYAWDKHKLIHRDVKPANIILTPDREVKLMDLGISKRQSENSEITMAGMMVGSPTYISPEQARAEKDMDFRADMYSLGATMFHMLTGRPPYDAEAPVAVISMHLSAPVPDPREFRPDISAATAALIMRMMAKNKVGRYHSWAECMDTIDSILERRGVASHGASLAEATRRAGERVISAAPLVIAKGFNPLRALSDLHSKILKVQPLHRIIALFVLLLVMLLAFASVVRRSVAEARAAQLHRMLLETVAASTVCSPEERPSVIARLEALARSSPPEIAAAALERIEQLKKRIIDERQYADAERAASILRASKAKSFVLEGKGDLKGALEMWEELAESQEFRADERMAKEAKDAIDYLKRSIKRKEAGL